MKYHVEFDKRAQKKFLKLEKPIRNQILLWSDKNIEGYENSSWTGKGLTADKIRLWRYRTRKYRLICDIREEYTLVLIIKAGNR